MLSSLDSFNASDDKSLALPSDSLPTGRVYLSGCSTRRREKTHQALKKDFRDIEINMSKLKINKDFGGFMSPNLKGKSSQSRDVNTSFRSTRRKNNLSVVNKSF